MLESLGGYFNDDGEIIVNLDSLFDKLAQIAFYITLAFALCLVIYLIVIRNKSDEELDKQRRLLSGIAVGYALGLIAVLGVLKLFHYILDEKITTNFWLVIGLFALAVVGIAVTIVLQKNKVPFAKWVGLAFAAAFAIYAVVLVIVIPAKSESYVPLNSALMYVLSAVMVAVLVAGALFFGKPEPYNAQALTYGAVCVALSFALSYVKFFSLPQGGSVTFASMLPLALYSYMFGTRRGLVAGVVYGLLQFVQSPQFYQPMQVLLDYPIAFGAVGLAGFARGLKFLKGNIYAEFVVGTSVAIILRYLSHVISGYFVFGSWAMEGYTALSWAFVYNLFTLVDLTIVLVLGVLALSSKSFRRVVFSANGSQSQTTEQPQVTEE